MEGNRMYIVAMRSKETLELQYVPFDYDYKRTANHASFDVIGRNLPRVQYTGGSTELSMTVEFTSIQDDRKDVIKNCTWLESLATSDGYDKPQERVMLVFGDLFRKCEWVISSCSIKYSNVHESTDYRPAEASVKLTLKRVSDYNTEYKDIRYETEHKTITYGTLAPQVNVAEIADTSMVSTNNPFANGEIREKMDGNQVLKRKKLTMAAKFLAQATYRTIVQGESLESLAYTTLRDKFPDAGKYWWILSDLNGMNGDPIDIKDQIGREILIPNVHEILFSNAMEV